MKMQDVKQKAKTLGVKPGRMKKFELIRAIQTAEGNEACFGNGTEACPQMDCCWRDDCLA